MTLAITTPRLCLRPLVMADAPAMVEGLGNFAVARWTGRVPWPYRLQDAQAFIAFTERAEVPSRFMAITLRGHQGPAIGVISFQFQAAAGDAELGYWLAEPFWGRGLGGEAARAMAEQAFMQDGLSLLVASHQQGNMASARILAALGFAETGHGMAHSLAQGRDVAVIYLSLPAERWRKKKATGF